ncbi:hypothetical protein C0993_004599 [Termitomyces sp. T159_Od127]|nr:hypothetical protein C0993_004599 [Termitomyces sp. T159_Od127]
MSDFDFAFDPALFPNPPPLPSSADLFSPDETLDLQFFLDNFGALDWQHDPYPYPEPIAGPTPPPAPLPLPPPPPPPPPPPQQPDAPARARPLLSSPQKRLNHIMSEQKRRNAIRDGYAQLIALLAPAGSKHEIGMPTRGRPKGSGLRGKGQTKGKSGVLFRAVEYVRWLEEGRDALRAEVRRVEAAAGIRYP